jgi:hypothetical protein
LAEAEISLDEDLPDDPFTGKPFLYRPQGIGYLLYSVGPNGKSDGGMRKWDPVPARMSYEQAQQRDDLAWWFNLPKGGGSTP